MDRRVILQKLENLRNCVQRIETKLPNDTVGLVGDYDSQDIVSVNFERAVQVCLNIAAHIGADFDDIGEFSAANTFLELSKHGVISQDLAATLARAAGFRNLLVHRYASIDWARVHASLTSGLGVFREYAAQVSRFIA